MKGVITVKSKERGVFSGPISLKSDKLLHDFKLKGKGGKLEILVQSDHPEHLSGVIVIKDDQTQDQDIIPNICFSFPKEISEKRKKYRATCQDCWTRQFAPWSCSFIKTGD